MHTANSAQSRNLRSRRTRPRILDCKEVGGAHFITHPSQYLTGPATAFARWTKMGGKGLSSASPVMLRCNTSVQDPDHWDGGFFRMLAASAEHKHRGDPVQRSGPHGPGMCLVRSECSVFRAGAWKTSDVMEVLSTGKASPPTCWE